MRKLLFLLNILTACALPAQSEETGKPFITLFTPGQTGGHYLDWAFIQDDRGMMYIGNGWGILEYDGSSWRIIKIPNGSFVRSFAKDSTGRIYVGSSTELGYLEADKSGLMQYISLLHLIPPDDRGFNYVWTIHTTREGIFFQTRERLFRFRQVPVTPENPEGWNVKVWQPENPEKYFIYSYYPDQHLYVLQRGIGLMKMVADSLVIIPGGEQFAGDRAYGLYPFDNPSGNLLFCTTTRGLWIYDGRNFKPFRTEADSLLYNGTPYDWEILPDGSFAAGTLSRGLVIIDRTGKIKMHLTRETGLLSNNVLSVFVDRQHNIWLGMAGGIGIFQYGSELMQFTFASGAVPFNLCRQNGILYASATDGIYYLDRNEPQFKPVPGLEISGPSNLLMIGRQLYAANVSGIFMISDRKVNLAMSYNNHSPAFNSLYQCHSDSSLIFAGAINGLGVLKYNTADDGHLSLVTLVKGINTYIRQVAEPVPGVFWLSTYNAGVIRLKFRGNNLDDPVIEKYGEGDGLPVGITSVFAVAGRLVFGTGKGFYKFEEKERKFIPDPFFKEVEPGVNAGECILVADSEDNIWANAGKETVFYRRMTDGKYQPEKTPASFFSDEFLYAIYPENNSTIWFGTTKSAIRYEIGKDTLKQAIYPALIRRVKLSNDSVITFMNPPADKLTKVSFKFAHHLNDLSFDFTTLSYIRPESNLFSTKLDGYDKQWSAYTDDKNCNYTNLPSGIYTLRVKAKNIYGQESTEDSLRFTILAPWYFTWWAFLGYFLMGGGIVYSLVYLRTRNLRARSLELEKLVRQRTNQIREQKGNIEKLSRIGKDITASLSIENIIKTASENVNSLMDASVFSIGLFNHVDNSLEFPAAVEKGRLLDSFKVLLNDETSLAAWCYNHRKEVFINHYEKEYRLYVSQLSLSNHETPESVMYLPLWNKEKVTGVISAQSFSKNAYTDYHLNILRNVATYSAIALENADAYRRLTALVEELKTTQNRLVTQSKLAALGELTAGISHELQNPLNFVTNFSEVSRELIDEVMEEFTRDNKDEAAALLNDIRQNLDKIIFHGKRADSIVKGMLQHSRGTSGLKQLTDINNLCDEFLRLAYHGLRAKDKSFNATLLTDFDAGLGMVNIVSQDIGRVILNLISNAFYAVNERKKLKEPDYEPAVTVRTKLISPPAGGQRGAMISVRDNGTGIPQNILDRIFQPFFTTKPSGEGTGLGLSLVYDIVTKGHGGELKVETQEGQGSEFIVFIPD